MGLSKSYLFSKLLGGLEIHASFLLLYFVLVRVLGFYIDIILKRDIYWFHFSQVHFC